MRPIDEIIIHCAATRADWWATRSLNQKVTEIRRWHVEDRGWSDIGYHYLIDRDGKVAEGRPLGRKGAHVKGHNTGSIGICLFGGHGSNENDAFSDNFTPAQDKALRELVASLRKRFPAIRKVSGHNEYAAKACPGFTVSNWIGGSTAPPVRPDVEPAPTPTIPAEVQAVVDDADGGGLASTTNIATAASAGTGIITAIAALDPLVAVVVVVVIAAGAFWVLRERQRKAAMAQAALAAL